jgi:nucleoid-associated protein YgaU
MGVCDVPIRAEAEMPNPKEPLPDFSSVERGSSSTAPSGDGSGRHYTVEEGDSLWKIAKQVYGDPLQWPKIHEANRDLIEDPDAIRPGQVLKLPGA